MLFFLQFLVSNMNSLQFIFKLYIWHLSQSSVGCLTWQQSVTGGGFLHPRRNNQSNTSPSYDQGESAAARPANENQNLPGALSVERNGFVQVQNNPDSICPWSISNWFFPVVNNKQDSRNAQNQFLWMDVLNIVLLLRAQITEFSISCTYPLKINTGRLLYTVWKCVSFNMPFIALDFSRAASSFSLRTTEKKNLVFERTLSQEKLLF